MTLTSYVARSRNALTLCLTDYEFQDQLARAATLIIAAFKRGNKLLICGNGGSAADAQHIASELVGTFNNRLRPGLPAIALTTDTSILTAVANDFDHNRIFCRQVAALGKSGDVLLAISTSGNSHNVLRACEQAKTGEVGMSIIGLTGREECGLDRFNTAPNVIIHAPAENTPLIQQIHQVAYHAMCEMIEEVMFPTGHHD